MACWPRSGTPWPCLRIKGIFPRNCEQRVVVRGYVKSESDTEGDGGQQHTAIFSRFSALWHELKHGKNRPLTHGGSDDPLGADPGSLVDSDNAVVIIIVPSFVIIRRGSSVSSDDVGKVSPATHPKHPYPRRHPGHETGSISCQAFQRIRSGEEINGNLHDIGKVLCHP